MANISRPFQIALAAVVLLAGVWLFALQGHSSTSQSSGSGSSPATSEQPATTPSTAYHGSAPGVAGLTRDVAKAKGAVSTSQRNANELESKSAAASSSSSTTSGTAGGSSGAAASSHPATSKASGASPSASKAHAPAAATTAPAKAAPAKASKPSALSAPGRQKQVESSLAAGNVVVLLFWNKKGADDVADAAAVRGVAKRSGKTAVMLANANEVAAFGTVTRGVQIFGTPTVVVVGRHNKATVLTGLTDVFSLQQAIAEARHA